MLRRQFQRDQTHPGLARRTLAGVAAGTLSAGVYLAAMYTDVRLTGHRYDPVRLAGRAVTRSPAWPAVGIAANLLLGVAVGASYGAIGERLLPGSPLVKGLIYGQGENLTLYPLMAPLVDRYHPDIRSGRLPRLMTWPSFLLDIPRHFAFGAALGLFYPLILGRSKR